MQITGKKIYIVICFTIKCGDFAYYIDSAWTSRRKAERRRDDLNSGSKEEWRTEFGYGIFDVEQVLIAK